MIEPSSNRGTPMGRGAVGRFRRAPAGAEDGLTTRQHERCGGRLRSARAARRWTGNGAEIVDRAFYVDALAMAERHVAQGLEHIDGQRQIIARLNAVGSDTTEAEALLATFLATQKQ